MPWISTRQAEKVGFKPSGPIRSAEDTVYYREDAAEHRILVISNFSPQYVVSFDLTKKQFRQFKQNKLSIVPPDCCSAVAGKWVVIEKHRVIHKGEINGLRHLRKILEAV